MQEQVNDLQQTVAELKGRVEELSKNQDSPKKKTWLDTLSSISPIISGVLIAIIGTAATILYDDRQMKLNQLEALDKYRSYISSENPVTRMFGFEAYKILGKGSLLSRLVNANASDKRFMNQLADASISSSVTAERQFGYEALVLLGKEDSLLEIVNSSKDGAAINILSSISATDNNETSAKAQKVADSIMASAKPAYQKDVLTQRQPEVVAGTKTEGWAYLGHYQAEAKNWKTHYFDFDKQTVPQTLKGEKLTVREQTGALNVRSGMPTLTGQFQPITNVLKPGNEVEIIKVNEWHSSGYMWAKISYLL